MAEWVSVAVWRKKNILEMSGGADGGPVVWMWQSRALEDAQDATF